MQTLTILEGDCLDVLKQEISDQSIQLIVTSPPYASQRKSTYGGIDPNQYVDWFLPRAAEFYRVLDDEGSFILNIKENVVDGERSTYVLELILALRKQGWLWTEEYIWHKRNATPGKWPNRFRDAWERCLHFTKQRKFRMYQDTVKVPVGDWASNRLGRLEQRHESETGSGFGRDISKWEGRNLVYPDNVLHMAAECSKQGHSAVYPVDLPAWFIQVFSAEGDTVLDPFNGSGTTGLAAIPLGRKYIGIEILPEYTQQTKLRLAGIWNPKKPLAEQIQELDQTSVLEIFTDVTE